MNAARRNRINKVISELAALNEEISAIRDEEQETFDNMPEGLQGSDRGLACEDAILNLEMADLAEVFSYLASAKGE